MRFQLNLRQKALILVAVPLLFELCLLASLYGLLVTAEKEISEADHAKQVIGKMNEAIQLFNDVGYAFVIYDAKTNKFFEDRFLKLLNKIPAEVNELTEIVSSEPAHLAEIKEVSREVNDMMRSLMESKKLVDAGERFPIFEAIHMRERLNGIVEKLDQIIDDAEAVRRKNPHVKERWQGVVKLALLIGTISSIVLALLLALLFHQGTTRRLGTLMYNIARFKEHKPLQTVLSGNDEIAKIDLVFHEMADALTRAAKEKQEFVDMVSHDLRSPLSAVQSSLSVLGSGIWGALSEKAQHKVAVAEDNIRRSIELINNLLDIERMDSGKFEISKKNVDLVQLLDIAAESLGQLAERKNIKIDTYSGEAEIVGDESRLSQVIANLLGNAIKFSPEGSTVKIDIADNQGWKKVMISDQGPGVPPEFQSLIFERFQQVPGEQQQQIKGSGLGLAICKKIIEALGGRLGVDSEPGRGSTFWFTVEAV